MKSTLRRQFAEELCRFSYLLNSDPDLHPFLEGKTKQDAENTTAQPQFFTLDKLREIFSTGEFLNLHSTSGLQLLKDPSSVRQLYHSASCCL